MALRKLWVMSLVALAGCAFDVPPNIDEDANPFDMEPSLIDAQLVDGAMVDGAMVDATPDDPALLATTQDDHGFGDVTTGEMSALLTIAIRNTGGGVSGTLGVSLGGANPGEFQIVAIGDGSDCASQTLDPEELCVVQVRYKPLTAIAAEASVDVTATPGGTVSVGVSGNGLSPGALEITSGAVLDFTSVEIQDASGFQSIVVHNAGTADTAALTVTLPNAVDYTLGTDTCNAAPLAGNATCSVQVKFNPTVVGSLPTSISIKDTPSSGVAASASGTGTARIALTKGTGGAVGSSPPGMSCGAGCTTSTISFSQTPVSLTASGTPDYVFDAWTGACASANPSAMCSVALTTPLTSVGATFRQVFTLGVSTTGPGVVTGTGVSCGNGNADCGETYDAGTMVTLTATPDTDYEVFTWTGASCTAGMRMCTVTMDQARSVAVEFKRQYTITVGTGGTGAGTVSGGSVSCPGSCSAKLFVGQMLTLTEAPATGVTGSRHVFGGWSGACTGGATTCNVTADADKSVTASFTLQYQLAATITGSGTLSGTSSFACPSGTCTQYYDSGTSVTITAAPSTNFEVYAWTGASCGAGTRMCSVTMDQLRNVTVEFRRQYTITVQVTGAGSVTGTGINCPAGACSALVFTGASLLLTEAPDTAAASERNLFVNWSGGGCTSGTTCNVTADADKTITATFKHQYQLSLTITGSGSVAGTSSFTCSSGTCTQYYDSGTSVSLTATPGTNYEVYAWTGATGGAGARSTSVTMSAVRSVTVEFRRQYLISYVFAGTGSGTVVGGTSVSCPGTCSQLVFTGDTITVNATPATAATGSRNVFSSWSGGGCTGNGTCVVTADADKTVTATFGLQYQLTVSVLGTGTGTITGTNAFACTSGTCTQYYDTGTSVTLSGSSGSVTKAVAFAGACTGATCGVTMSAARDVSATFELCPGARLGFTISNVAACDVPEFGGDITLSGAITINTTAGTVMNGATPVSVISALVTQNSGPYGAMVIAQNNFTIASGAVVTVTGSRPLIVIAQNNLTVSGTLDASAALNVAGPGAELACSTGDGANGVTQGTANGGTAGAGGGGAGYGTAGGTGAYAYPNVGTTPRTAAGAMWGNTNLAPLLGGCHGGTGGLGNAPGGGGGGGVQLVAGAVLQVTATGVVAVAGGGGSVTAAMTSVGGGGGGGGGSILGESATITIAGALTANGGGGGAGRGTQTASIGADGSKTTATPASGGTSSLLANGGAGGAGTTAAVEGSIANGGCGTNCGAGGGGGGGAVGRIHLSATTLNTAGSVISPPQT